MIKKIKKITTYICAYAFIITGIVFSLKSTVWKSDTSLYSTSGITKVDKDWSFYSNEANSHFKNLTLTRMFTAEEINSYMHKDESNLPPCLFFVTKNQSVRVFTETAEGKRQVYSFGNNGRLYAGSQSGPAVHFVLLEDAKGQNCKVSVMLSPSFNTANYKWNNFFTATFRHYIPDFYVGSQTRCISTFKNYLRIQSIPSVVTFMLSLSGLLIFIVLYFRRKEKNMGFLGWSALCFFLSLGTYMSSLCALYHFGNTFLRYFLTVIYIAACPKVIVYFMHGRNMLFYSEKVGSAFSKLSNVNIFLVCITAFIKFIPFSAVCFFIDTEFLFFLIYVAYAITKEVCTVKQGVSLMDVTMLIACATVFIDVLRHFLPIQTIWDFACMSYGTLQMAFFAGISIALEYFESTILTERSKIKKEVMFTDRLCGCGSEASFWLQFKKTPELFTDKYLSFINVSNFITICTKYSYAEGESAISQVYQQLEICFPGAEIYRFYGARFWIYFTKEQYVNYEQKIRKIIVHFENLALDDSDRKIEIDEYHVFVPKEKAKDIYTKLFNTSVVKDFNFEAVKR